MIAVLIGSRLVPYTGRGVEPHYCQRHPLKVRLTVLRQLTSIRDQTGT